MSISKQIALERILTFHGFNLKDASGLIMSNVVCSDWLRARARHIYVLHHVAIFTLLRCKFCAH